MLHKFKASLVAVLAITSVFSFNGCNKKDQSTTPTPSTTDIPEWARAEMRKQTGGFTYVINQRSPAMYLDENGNERRFSSARLSDIPCDSEEDDFENNTFTHLYQSIWYACGQDFKVIVEYELSTAFTPVAVNPSNPAQVSRGRFRIFDQNTNTTLYSNSSVTPVTIVLKGPDPSYPGKNIYRISYTVTGLSESIMNMGGTFENRPIIYSSCPEVITTPLSWQGALPGPMVDACSKIDNIAIFPSGNPREVFVSGCDVQANTTGSCYPASLASGRPHEHDIEWRKPGDATYGNWPAPYPAVSAITASTYSQRLSWAYFTGQGCSTNANKRQRLSFFDARTFTFPVSGTIEVRYRNAKLVNFVSACSAVDCATPDWIYVNLTLP